MDVKPYNKQQAKSPQVEQMFDTIAPRYDLLNRLLSLGIDQIWRRRLVRKIYGGKVLDVACGTGDLAIMMSRKVKEAQITGCDISQGMLSVARQKIDSQGLKIELKVAPAEDLPFDDNFFDNVTCAFGVRNFGNLQTGLSQMYRVVKSGGHVHILEFSTPKNGLMSRLFKFYFHTILPRVGGWISGDAKAYKYLPQSVDAFASGNDFLTLLSQAGFEQCSMRSMTFGVATIYSGTKK